MSTSRRWLCVGVSLLLALASGCSEPVAAVGVAQVGVAQGALASVRVLVLAGGGYHEFGKNLEILLPALKSQGSFSFTTLWLGPQSPSAGAAPAGQGPGVDLPLDPGLAQHVDVLLAYTQGDLHLDDGQRAQILRFVRGGGGFVGLHCAVDSYPGWAEYVQMCGAKFLTHPPFGPIHVSVEPTPHPITAGLPAEWDLKDEFYHLQDWELGAQTVLMSGISPAGGEVRPVTWCKPYGKGRVACTILGHGAEVHGDARYQQLVAQALVWAAGR
ncbi:MAG TPA: ThuA domain-containing protein [Planctomycetota bacterium]|nr:ThuA domain-containing protein [Planctomycetota bacterium]